MRFAIALVVLATTQALADTAVTVDVAGVSRDEGQMVLTVYDSKKNWLKRGHVQAKMPVDGSDAVSFSLALPPGEYAFHVYQDLDSNDEMKTNFIGIPKEPTGVSNDAKGKFGPPKYKDAMLVVGDEPVTVPINLTEID
ncbi:MAG: DUF2141 domain-containing protein [Gammaproteobacteria bacterium]|nr:DUF2141 domain-containing protein [Gammaproteobacteria bacterium]